MKDLRFFVFIPCVNEAANIARTISSLVQQTRMPDGIIVGDHNSTDNTAEIARALGVTVIHCNTLIKMKGACLQGLLKNKVFKEMIGPYNYKTTIVGVIDGDTILEKRAIERLLKAFEDPKVGCASGGVLPFAPKSIWQLARVIEYHLATTIHKRIQGGYGSNLVCSGCLAGVRLSVLIRVGGFPQDCLSEDLLLTWLAMADDSISSFVPDAIAYTQEPPNFRILWRQLERWGRGFFDAVRIFRKHLLSFDHSSFSTFVLYWMLEGFLAPFLLIFAFVSMLSHNFMPFSIALCLTILSESVMTIAPVMISAVKHQQAAKAIKGFSAYYILRLIAIVAWWRNLYLEVKGKKLDYWDKGH